MKKTNENGNPKQQETKNEIQNKNFMIRIKNKPKISEDELITSKKKLTTIL